MPTNRPFLANFLAAFRAHSSSTYKASSSPSSPGPSGPSSLSTSAHVSTSTSTAPASASASAPRSIATKANSSNPINPTSSPPPNSAVAAAAAAAASSHLSHSRSPGVSTPIGLGGGIPGMGASGSTTPRGRQRRGSDSSNSSGGFRDALGPEKWYIGGRTAAGEERFYRVGMVTATGTGGRRVRSLDRLSL